MACCLLHVSHTQNNLITIWLMPLNWSFADLWLWCRHALKNSRILISRFRTSIILIYIITTSIHLLCSKFMLTLINQVQNIGIIFLLSEWLCRISKHILYGPWRTVIQKKFHCTNLLASNRLWEKILLCMTHVCTNTVCWFLELKSFCQAICRSFIAISSSMQSLISLNFK